MNAAQIHLALNHLPIHLLLVGLPLLAISLWRHSHELKTAAAVLLFLSSACTIPVFLSGEPTEEKVANIPGVTTSFIHSHEEAGEFSLVLASLLGIFTLTLWLFEKKRKIELKKAWILLFLFGLLCFAVFARTAHLGGLIHHQELG